MASIFTKIVKGEIPCHKILEDNKYFAFLEILPLRPGHTLVIPKQEVDYFFDLDNTAMNELLAFSRKVAAALKKATPCKKVAVIVYGLEVPHAHVHLVPVDGTPGELNFTNPRGTTQEALADMAKKIKQTLGTHTGDTHL